MALLAEYQLKIAIVVGSIRAGNYTGMASALVANELARHPNLTVETIQPERYDLPLPGMPESPGVETLQKQIECADAIVFSTPEYNGGFSSITKIVIENLGYPSRLAGKPIALLGVASGVIGAVKSLEQLRSVVSHVGGIVLPRSCSVAMVEGVFTEQGDCKDADAERQIRKFARGLVEYLDANVRPRRELERILREQSSTR